MSCNYAEGLSPYEHKGKLGLPEVFDSEEEIETKVKQLAEWLKESKHSVVHTGAGISTSAGIPDFRGPKGVWTLEKKGLKPEINVSFEAAEPTLTHMALTNFVRLGMIKYIITQNIDGLHLRSGLPRTNMSELHGNMFVAQCNFCDRQIILPKSVSTVGQKEIGRPCPFEKPGGRTCRGKLKDNILDWDANLPDRDLDLAISHSTLSDLSICLGTTLQIIPAGNLPLKAKKNPGGKLVIINLQPTKHDKKADLLIHAKVDGVFRKLAELLGVTIPEYCSEIDPSRNLMASQRSQDAHKIVEWTIALSAVKTTAKLCQEKQPQKSKKPSASVRRRRKKRRSESSNDSEDEKLPEPSYKRQRIFINSTSSADTPADSSSKTEPVPKTLQNERIIS